MNNRAIIFTIVAAIVGIIFGALVGNIAPIEWLIDETEVPTVVPLDLATRVPFPGTPETLTPLALTIAAEGTNEALTDTAVFEATPEPTSTAAPDTDPAEEAAETDAAPATAEAAQPAATPESEE